MLPRLSLLSGEDFRPSPMQTLANASYAQGRCGKANELQWRAIVDTNRMTTSPSGSFSSTNVFRTSDTGQAFAPADFSPELSIDGILLANPQLDRHFAEAGGSLHPGCTREISLSCTVTTTRDDESLRPLSYSGLTQHAGLEVNPPLLLVSHRLALRPESSRNPY